MPEQDDLAQFISEIGKEHKPTRDRGSDIPDQPATSIGQDGVEKALRSGSPVQWLAVGDDGYVEVTETIKKLPVGTYGLEQSQMGIVFRRLRIVTDELIYFPESRTDAVITGIRKFWKSKQKFLDLKQIHKRGILIYGPPGGGKTARLIMLCKELEQVGGMVINGNHPGLASAALRQLRKIEPERPLICILEDLDELVCNFGEAGFLSLLDGENQVDNICFIATTNYPARLDPRFVNRPSRFDEVVKIGMPSAKNRRIYLERRVGTRLASSELAKWVEDTEGMSLAHLRELVVSIFCLEASYDEVIARLRLMGKCQFEERKFGIEPLVNGKAQVVAGACAASQSAYFSKPTSIGKVPKEWAEHDTIFSVLNTIPTKKSDSGLDEQMIVKMLKKQREQDGF